MNRQKESAAQKSAPIFAMALFILMLGCILLLCVFGSSIYGAIVKERESIDSKRAELSYVVQKVRAQDEKGAVKIAQGPSGDALVLMELSDNTGCETRIYMYEGRLLEEYALSNTEFDAQNAQFVANTESFAVKIEDGLLCVTTDAGTARIKLRTQEAF